MHIDIEINSVANILHTLETKLTESISIPKAWQLGI